MTIEETREVWGRAAEFPFDKEAVYPAHAMAQQFDSVRGCDVLDYGCGGGPDSRSYYLRGNRVVAADVTPRNVEVARERLAGLAPVEGALVSCVLLEDSAPLPFAAEAFDVVSSHGVLHHIRDDATRAQVVAEFFRVLRPGGRLFVMLYSEWLWGDCTRNVRAAVAKGTELGYAFGSMTDGPGAWARFYTEPEGQALLEAAGFELRSTFLYNDGHFRTYRAVRP